MNKLNALIRTFLTSLGLTAGALGMVGCSNTQPTITQNAQTAPASAALEHAAPELEATGQRVALEQGYTVSESVSIQEEGRKTAFLSVTTREGVAGTLLVTAEKGAALVTAQDGAALQGQLNFKVQTLGGNGQVLEAQGIVTEWVFQRLTDLVTNYARAPKWAKYALKGPLRGIIKVIIGTAINAGCKAGFDALANALRVSNRWVPLTREIFCDIVA